MTQAIQVNNSINNNQRADRNLIQELPLAQLPLCLQNVSSPPQRLFIKTTRDDDFVKLMRQPRVAIVGSRKVSAYGEIVTDRLAGELAAQGVVIISGLAIGVDAIAHQAALNAKGLTMAVLPSPIEKVHPSSHQRLANQILDADGAIISEYPAGSNVYVTNFIARNRIVSGLADALLITEAAEKSGTMHTARFALEQGIEVMAVPGSILSSTSEGTNNLIKSGATPVTTTNDILHILGLQTTTGYQATVSRVRGANVEEQHIIELLEQGITDGNQLLTDSELSVEQFNHHLTMLEITSKVRALGANRWALC